MASKQSVLVPPADDPQPEWRWQILYEDTFDRESPPSVEVEGIGLLPALAELWARFLLETVQTASANRDGAVEEIPWRGFTELALVGPQRRLRLEGSLVGAMRLKGWMYPQSDRTIAGAETQLLRALADAHARSGAIEDAALAILDAAESAADRSAFEATLAALRDRWG